MPNPATPITPPRPSQAELHIVSGGWHLLGLSLNGGTADEARRSFLGLA